MRSADPDTVTKSKRFESLADFWPHYLSAHRLPMDRVFHFVGTMWFFSCALFALINEPTVFLFTFGMVCLIGIIAMTWIEPRRAAIPEMLLMIAICAIASPILLLGIVGAYAWAWFGHFVIEHNSPAAMRYPVWSLVCDFRMWGQMLTGRLWTGDSMTTNQLASLRVDNS